LGHFLIRSQPQDGRAVCSFSADAWQTVGKEGRKEEKREEGGKEERKEGRREGRREGGAVS
jgi:hypothetical protein